MPRFLSSAAYDMIVTFEHREPVALCSRTSWFQLPRVQIASFVTLAPRITLQVSIGPLFRCITFRPLTNLILGRYVCRAWRRLEASIDQIHQSGNIKRNHGRTTSSPLGYTAVMSLSITYLQTTLIGAQVNNIAALSPHKEPKEPTWVTNLPRGGTKDCRFYPTERKLVAMGSAS